jgi:hypothetical protein
MIGGTLAQAIRIPFTAPTRAPTARQIKNGKRNSSLISLGAMASIRYIMVPTDMSIPPVKITSVSPKAAVPKCFQQFFLTLASQPANATISPSCKLKLMLFNILFNLMSFKDRIISLTFSTFLGKPAQF